MPFKNKSDKNKAQRAYKLEEGQFKKWDRLYKEGFFNGRELDLTSFGEQI